MLVTLLLICGLFQPALQENAQESNCCPLPDIPYGSILSVYGQRLPGDYVAPYTFIIVTCLSGFSVQSGSMQGYCLRDGSWSTTIGKCTKNSQGGGPIARYTTPAQSLKCIVPIVSNGHLEADRYRAPMPLFNFDVECGTHVSLACDPGYEPKGNSESDCISGGIWSKAIGRCVLSIPPVIAPPQTGCDVPEVCDGYISVNGGPRIETTGFVAAVYSTVELTCKPGYYLIGNQKAACVCDREWSNDLGKCIQAPTPPTTPSPSMWCLLPLVVNGRFLTTDGNRVMGNYVATGMSFLVCCDVGYYVQGPDKAVCSGGDLKPSVGSCRSIWELLTSPRTLPPTTTTSMVTTMQWTSCALPQDNFGRFFTVEGQMLTSSSVAVGTAIILRCNPGCEPTDGSRSAVCYQGRFMPSLGRCRRTSGSPCDLPDVSNGHFCTTDGQALVATSVSDAMQVILKCTEGYAIEGGVNKASCNDGIWSDNFARCKYVSTKAVTTQAPRCILPIASNGRFFSSEGQRIVSVSVTDGMQVVLRCDPGYVVDPVYHDQAYCRDMEWSLRLGTCRTISCGSAQKTNSQQLITAARSGDTRSVQDLLSQAADPDSQDSSGWSALMWAANNNYPAVMTQLLNCDANIDLVNSVGSTALLFAAKGGFVEATRFLLTKRANPNAQNTFGSTALAFAAQKGETEVVKVLLLGSANTELKDNDGVTALFWAVKGNYTTTVQQLLIAGANPDTSAKDGSMPLLVAAKNGYLQIVRLLIENGADVNATDPDGNSALSLADGYGHTEVSALLLQRGATRKNSPL